MEMAYLSGELLDFTDTQQDQFSILQSALSRLSSPSLVNMYTGRMQNSVEGLLSDFYSSTAYTNASVSLLGRLLSFLRSLRSVVTLKSGKSTCIHCMCYNFKKKLSQTFSQMKRTILSEVATHRRRIIYFRIGETGSCYDSDALDQTYKKASWKM